MFDYLHETKYKLTFNVGFVLESAFKPITPFNLMIYPPCVICHFIKK